MTQAQETVSAALAYIAMGWAVVPLHDVTGGQCSCGSADPKHHPKQGGKHPVGLRWQNAGLRTPAAVAEAWAGRPSANIGIVTGRASGIWVLDVDPDNGGDARLAALIDAYGVLPETWVVQTGSGGRHYYWQMPEFDFTTSRGSLPVGLDVRGNSGQVVAPPSQTLKGPYRLLVNAPVAPAPGWLLGMIRPAERETGGVGGGTGETPMVSWGGWHGSDAAIPDRGPAYARSAISALMAQLAGAPPGTRNETAYRVGRRLAELVNSPWSGLSESVDWIYQQFLAAAEAADIDGGFSQAEAADVLRKAIRDQQGRGATLPAPDHLGTPVGWVDQAPPPFVNPGEIAPGVSPMSTVLAPGPDPFEVAVATEMGRIKVREVARARVDAAAFLAGWAPPAGLGTLAEELQLPETEQAWRVPALLPAGGNALVVAARKVGKTTLMGCLLRSLVDGIPFLGRYIVEPVDGAVALFNYENTPRQQRAWLRELQVANPGRVHVLHLRGHSLSLAVPQVRAWVVGWLREREIKVWVPDPYARAGQGLVDDENSNSQANAFTLALDEIKAAAGVTEIVIPAHASGKTEVEPGAERVRGAGRLEDWADAIWYLNQVEGARFIRATGRDVDLDESQLYFDRETRNLTLGEVGKGRREASAERDGAAVLAVLRDWTQATPPTQNDLRDACDLGSARRIGAAVAYLVARDLVWIEPGPNRSKYHHAGSKPNDR